MKFEYMARKIVKSAIGAQARKCGIHKDVHFIAGQDNYTTTEIVPHLDLKMRILYAPGSYCPVLFRNHHFEHFFIFIEVRLSVLP